MVVWIPGGGLVLEAASMYDASAIVAFENYVFMTIQYRLGAFKVGHEAFK